MAASADIGSILDDFARAGIVVVEDFFDTELMDVLDGLIRDYFGDNPDFRHNDEFLEAAQTEVIPWFPQDDGVKAFDAIDDDARLRALTEAILGNGWANHYCMVMFSKKGTTGQAWHQDCPPEDSGMFNLNRLVYTRSITDEVGGQPVVVPGSYRKGLLPAGDPLGEFEDQVVLRPGKGTLVLIHGHSWHRVLPIEGDYRYSVNYRAGPAGSTADLTDVCVYRNMRYRFSTSRIIEERVGELPSRL